MARKEQDIRQAIEEALIKLMNRNKDVYFVSADMADQFPGLVEKCANQVIDVGIAEQDMVGIAAGMAYVGKVVYTSTLAAMATMRPCEQIRTDCCYPNMNVNIMGQGRGLAYGFLGTTHHAPEDIGILRSMPNMTILLPADALEAQKMIAAVATRPGPSYIGVGKGMSAIVTDDRTKFEIGKAITLNEGSDVSFIATGSMVVAALDAAEILKKEGIKARVINMHTIKPLDKEAIIKAAKETGAIVTVEDHNVLTGLGSAVAEVLSEEHPVIMKRVGIPDIYCAIGHFDQLMAKYKMDAPSLADTAKQLIGKKK